MTCIVAIKHLSEIHIGGDSIISDDNSKFCMKQSKVFSTGEEIIGCAGDLRFISLISNWTFPKRSSGDTVNKYINIDIIDSLREHLNEGGYSEKENDQEKIGSNMIFTYDRNLYVMDANFGVWSPKCNYAAIGSGSDFAHGSLFALAKIKMPADQKIKISLDAASKHAIGVGPPYNLLIKKITTATTRNIEKNKL